MKLRRFGVAVATVIFGSLLAVSCSNDNSPTKGGSSTPPTVESTIPEADATSIAVTVQPSVTFSKEIDPLTGSGSIVLEKSGVAVPGELSFNGRTVTFIPSTVLDSGADYSVTVKTSVYDKNGLALAAPYTWRFSTVSRPAGSYSLVWEQGGNAAAKIMAGSAEGAPQSLTTDGNARWLTWSPNGQKLMYVLTASGCHEIWTMNADGSGKVRVAAGPTPCPAEYGHSWSPDGSRIAVLTAGTTHDLYVMNADGSNPVLVTSGLTQAEWSRDGTRFAVIKGSSLSVMNADGSGAAPTTEDAKAIIGWKAASDTLVYVTTRDSLATIRAGGSDKVFWQPLQYFVDPARRPNVALTRDGNRVVYQQHYQIHYTNFTTGIRHFVNLPFPTRDVDISSDGQWLAVVSGDANGMDIVLVSFDGTQNMPLVTNSGIVDRGPRFRPTP